MHTGWCRTLIILCDKLHVASVQMTVTNHPCCVREKRVDRLLLVRLFETKKRGQKVLKMQIPRKNWSRSKRKYITMMKGVGVKEMNTQDWVKCRKSIRLWRSPKMQRNRKQIMLSRLQWPHIAHAYSTVQYSTVQFRSILRMFHNEFLQCYGVEHCGFPQNTLSFRNH